MKKPTLQELIVFMFLVLALLLSAYSLGQDARAAEPAYTPEQTCTSEQQKAKENSSSEKASLKKRGHVRIATIGPQPFRLD